MIVLKTSPGILILIGLLLLAGSVAAADFAVINQGATMYIGEVGLNVTHALNQAQGSPDADGIPPLTAIGWWPSPALADMISPAKIIDLGPGGRYRCMTAEPSDFSGYTGDWYLLRADGTPVQS